MVADLSALYLIRVGDRTFVRRGTPAAVVMDAMHGVKAADPLPDPRDAAELALQADLEALFRTLAPDVAAMLAKGQMPTDKELGDAFAAVIRPALVETAIAEFGRQAVEVGVQFDPATVNVRMRDWASSYSYDLVKGLNETTRAGLQQAMTAFTETPGMTRGELEALVREVGFSDTRASAIAVTETTRASSAGIEGYQQDLLDAGITTEKIWHTAHDELTCILCRPLNGVPEHKWESLGASGPPPRHVHCRCHCTLRHVATEQS
jgi:hypothetical protein